MPTEPVERKKNYLKRKKSGLCPRCGGSIKKNSKFIYCDDCREYYRGYNRDASDSIQEARRDRYELRKAKGCCPRCGVFVGKKADKILCPSCLNKQYKYNNGTERPKKTAAKKPAAKKAAAKKSTVKKQPVKKSTAKKSAVKKTAKK